MKGLQEYMLLRILQGQYLLKLGLVPIIQRFVFLKNLLHCLKSLYSYRIVLRTFYHFYETVKNFNMKKQRICIVGDGLSGLMAALALNKLEGLEVYLISKKSKNSKDKRITAISASNYEFFNEVIDKLDQKLFWPSKKIDLFYETKDQNMNFLNFNEDSKNLMYVFENDKIKEILIKEIKKSYLTLVETDLGIFDFTAIDADEHSLRSGGGADGARGDGQAGHGARARGGAERCCGQVGSGSRRPSALVESDAAAGAAAGAAAASAACAPAGPSPGCPRSTPRAGRGRCARRASGRRPPWARRGPACRQWTRTSATASCRRAYAPFWPAVAPA